MRAIPASRVITLLGSVLTFLTVTLPPVTYLVFTYRYVEGTVVTEAAFGAEDVTQVIARNPEMWRYEHVRLVELLSRRPARDDPEVRRIVDLQGRVVARGAGSAPAPSITSAMSIYDAGVVVGRVEVTRSLRPAVLRATVYGLMLLPVGALVFVLLRTLPLRAIRRSEKRFRALIERSRDMIILLDRELRIAFWSPGAVEAMGWSAAETRGRRVLEFVHDDDRERVGRALAELVVEPGRALRAELSFRQRGGAFRTLEALGRNLLDDPAVAGMVVNARDVTEQRRLEEEFRQAQKLESIGRLAGGVAHDFNNLLTVILACAESLRGALQAGAPAQREDVDDIHDAAERARDLTRHLLAFARKQVLAPVPLDLNAILRGSERLLRRVLGEDVELVVRLAPDLWRVRCDPGQMEQVVVNLAANARDAMPRSGTLTVETGNFRLEAEHAAAYPGQAPGEYVRLVVRDSGSGLAPEAKAHLFEPFFTTKPRGRGTGLGLPSVYGIVSQSGGFIQVESEPGRGTAFELFFPRTLQPVVAASAASPRSAGGTETVLVVEDDAEVRAVTVRPLRGAGYRVIVAPSGLAALELPGAELATVQLLVTDVVMPGLDGRELAQRLCTRYPGLRVLYVSGYTQGAIVERGVLDSGSDFLPKPFTGAALLACVRALLDAAPAAAPAPAAEPRDAAAPAAGAPADACPS